MGNGKAVVGFGKTAVGAAERRERHVLCSNCQAGVICANVVTRRQFTIGHRSIHACIIPHDTAAE